MDTFFIVTGWVSAAGAVFTLGVIIAAGIEHENVKNRRYEIWMRGAIESWEARNADPEI